MGRSKSSDSSSYDSVLDVMTNVVGILIIIAIIAQVSVSDAVKRTKSKQLLPSGEVVTKEMLEAAQTQQNELQSLLSQLNARWQSMSLEASDQERSLMQIEESIERLRRELKSPTSAPAESDSLKKLEDAYAQKADSLINKNSEAKETVKSLNEYSRNPEMFKTPIIRLPDPNPKRTEGRKQLSFYCKNEALYPFKRSKLLNEWFELEDIVDKSRRSTGSGAEGQFKAYIEYWKTDKIQNEFFQLIPTYKRIYGYKTTNNQERKIAGNIKFVCSLRTGANGDSINELSQPSSYFARELGKYDKDDIWIYF